MKKIWVVYSPAKGRAEGSHDSLQSAIEAAHRVSKGTGLDAYVLELVHACSATVSIVDQEVR